MSSSTEFLIAVGVLGAFVAGYHIFKRQTQEGNQAKPEEKKKPAFEADLTLAELRQYDGETKPEVFIALKGVVYDVSSSEFYKKPSGYAMFSGHDASISLAKMSHDADHLNKWNIIPLSAQQEGVLNDWVARFQSKYPVVGKVKLA